MESITTKIYSKKRNCGSKVRGGCRNCKKSHVKCDQNRPSCRRCSTTKKECDYPDTFRPVITCDPRQIDLEMSPRENLSSNFSNTPCPSLSPVFGERMETQDRFYFYYFHQSTCIKLSSLLPSTFWNHYVLPMSANSPAVQYAILALAAQHKVYTEFGPIQFPVPESPEMYPLSSYGKAIRSLNRRIDGESNDALMIQESLVACLLFICLNILQGNDIGAMTHLSSGLKLNRHLSKSLPDVNSGSDSGAEPIHQLIETFRRLDLQAALYLGSHQITSASTQCDSHPNSVVLKKSKPIFQSVEEARRALTDIILSASYFIRSTAEPLKYVEFEDPESTTARQRHALNLRDTYIQQLHEWQRSLEIYSSSLSAELRNDENLQCSKCSVLYAQTVIALSVCLSPNETEYDTCVILFLSILENAEVILSPTEGPNSQGAGLQNNLFDLEASVIQPLYFTALKCRVPNMRYRAIALMYQAGKEGVWDGALMARIARHVAELEENQRRPSAMREDTEIWEENRVCGVAINVMRKESKVWVECSTRRWTSSCLRSENLVPEQKHNAAYVWEFHEDILSW
ncbi:hypothetical protein OIDMADRAFT_144129 [Oidiodendron maius Zn]|uniref:Zn(2)-C6 fungal-type domain-containing protein n=1 Tax=Oidiodendron maius (strain Zn) TaxID=913774 RepID=A0A0C3H4B4_OIDMZ|nr:hypothetical protein OIDMADRAFT_144129 [Oidiodendron maius Zn]